MGRPALYTLGLVLLIGILLPSQCRSGASGDAPHVGVEDADDGGGSGSPPTTTTSSSGCTLYLAPSAIPNAGLGTFTAVEIAEGQPIGSPEIVHNIIDLALQ